MSETKHDLPTPCERSFIMLKPDAVQRGLVGKVIQRFEEKGFKLVAMKFLLPSRAQMESHYADLSSKPFISALIDFMTSGPVVPMVWEGTNIVQGGRKMLGETDPADSCPGSIRGDFCVDVRHNVIHGSDSVESATREIALWFPEGMLSECPSAGTPTETHKPKAKGQQNASAAAGAGSGAGGSTATPERDDGTKFVHLDNPTWSRGSRSRVASIINSPDHGASQVGKTVTVGGWVKTKRAQKHRVFVQLNDGSTVGNLQLVVEEGCEGYDEVRKSAGTGSCVHVTGTLVESPAAGQAVDLMCTSATVMGGTGSNYPLAKKKHHLETLRQIQHLRPRSYMFGAVTRVRNACAYATHQFFQSRDFLYIHTPIVTTADCEGAGEMFQVTTLLPSDGKGGVPRMANGDIDYNKDFFGKPTGLTVSGQLQVESFAVSMSDVYTFGPTFRAEASHTSRHLAEFWMIEPEIVFATLEDDMNLAEDYLKFCTKFVRDHCADDVAYFNDAVDKTLKARLDNLINTPFHRISYTDAVELLLQPEHLEAGQFETKPFWGIDLGSEHEKYLTKLFNGPTVVYNYPKSFKAFYMKQNEDGKTVQAMDVLVPGIGELIGGSAREDDLGKLEALMAEKGLEKEGLEWYLDLRRHGSVPHAGFGLGFERLVMYMTGVENIKDVIPFPRSVGQALM